MPDKMSEEELEEFGIELMSKDELLNVTPGDWIDCDRLHQSLLHAGYDADYENVYIDKSGFMAVFTIDGERVGSVVNEGFGHMVREWRGLEG